MVPSQRVWFFEYDGTVRQATIVSRGAHASTIEYRANGLCWQVLVSNDDIEFIGDDQLDDED